MIWNNPMTYYYGFMIYMSVAIILIRKDSQTNSNTPKTSNKSGEKDGY